MAEYGAQDCVSVNTRSVVSSSPDLLNHSKAHMSFFMLCFYLPFCICLAVLNGGVGTVSHYKLACYLHSQVPPLVKACRHNCNANNNLGFGIR